MEKGIAVKDITPGAEVRGVFAVTQAAQAQSRNGPYWRLTLADAGGSVEAKIWSPLSAEFTDIPVGALVLVEARAGTYRDQIIIMGFSSSGRLDYGCIGHFFHHNHIYFY